VRRTVYDRPWHGDLRQTGPLPAQWEGRDATGWVLEVFSDESSRRILVEVSGTAMATADEYLPEETV
jgi:hypothetical protein